MKNSLLTFALLGAFSLSTVVHAETPMELVIVTPTRVAQTLNTTIADTTVIDEEAIRKSGAADLPGLLRSLPGVEIYQNGGVGKQSSIFLRGSNSSHTLVLLDGVRVNSATAGSTQIDQIMLDNIERIEVVRGNVSSVYGSEAIGGVIQLFSKHGSGTPKLDFSTVAGTHNTRRASVGYGGETGRTSFDVRISRFETDGVSAINATTVPTVNPDADGYANTSISINLRQAITDAQNLSVSWLNSDARNQTDDPFGLSTDVNSSQSRIRKLAAYLDSHINDHWQSKLQVSQGIDEIQNFLNGVPDLNLGAQFKTTSNMLSWLTTLQMGNDQDFVGGFERLQQHVDSSTVYTRTGRADNSIFGGYTRNYGVHKVQLNIRRDNYSDFGGTNTWLLGYGYQLADSWRLTATASTAFKAPTLNDLFYPFTDYGTYGGVSYSYVGNPDLKPERSRNEELGLHLSETERQANLVYFDNHINDLIVSDGLPAGSMTNLNQARCNGLEFSYRQNFGDTTLSLAATRQNPRDAKSGQVLLRRAKNYFNAGIEQKRGDLTIGAKWQHNGERIDADIISGARTTLAPYDNLSVNARYRMQKRLDVSFQIDNVANENFVTSHGYNIAGRTFLVGLNYAQ